MLLFGFLLYAELLKTVTTAHHALLMPKNIEAFPGDKDRMSGTIDIWWILSILCGNLYCITITISVGVSINII